MTMTLKKNMAITTLLIMVLMLALSFSFPVVTYAADTGVNGATVKIDPATGELKVTGLGTDSVGASAWNDLITKYKAFIVGISGIGAVTMIVLFIFQFIKLGASAGNPQGRSQALSGVLWTGLAAAGLGAVTIIVGFFYNAIR